MVETAEQFEEAEVLYNPDQLEENAKNDLNFLAGLALPLICTIPFPPVFLSVWQLLIPALFKVRDFSKFAIGLPRGHGKTILLKLLILYIILFTDKKYILVVCATATKAEDILTDVVDMLNSDNIFKVFGNWEEFIEINRMDLKKFTFRGRTVMLEGIGAQTKIRGASKKFVRPDVIIMDDMQSKECAESETQALALVRWLTGTLMKAKNPFGCTFIYVGNMYPDHKIGGSTGKLYTCILRNLQKNPSWQSWIVGAILAEGTAIWEALQPLVQLLQELADDIAMDCPEVFYAEVLNDPSCGSGKHFNISKLPSYDISEDAIVSGRFIIIDPSLGKKKSDAQVVLLFDVIDTVPVLKQVHIRQESSPKLVQFVLKLAINEQVPLVCAEADVYQATLLQWFEFFANLHGIMGVEFRPVSSKGRKKNSRILSMFKTMMEGKVKVHPLVLGHVLNQISVFNPLITDNVDDIIDTLSYWEDVMLEYAAELILPYDAMLSGLSELDVVEDNCCY